MTRNISNWKYIAIWCFATLTISIKAQTIGHDTLLISGMVHDMNNDPVIGASVEIPFLKCNTETNIDGEFSFTSFGEFSELSDLVIEVRLTGYNPKDTVFTLKNEFDVYSKRKFFVEIEMEYNQPGPTIIQAVEGYTLHSLVPEGFETHDYIYGNLNLDAYPDIALVLNNVADTSDLIFNRPLLILQGIGQGMYKQMGRNDKILACRVCGGNVDDPYMGIVTNKGSLTINQHAGSAWLTTWSYTFTFDPSDQELKLQKEIFNTFHSTEFQKENVTENTQKYGISFDAWKPDE